MADPISPKLLHQLPPEIQRRVADLTPNSDLASLARTNSHYHRLASETLYRCFDQTFPDNNNAGDVTRAIDNMTMKLDTLVSSKYDYCQYLQEFRLYSTRGTNKSSFDNSRSRRPTQVSNDGIYAAIRLLNTLLVMVLKRCALLHTFIWNINQGLSTQILELLQRHHTLRRLQFRLKLAQVDSSFGANLLAGSSTYHPDVAIISGDSSVSSHTTTISTPTAPLPTNISTRRSVSQAWRPEVISGFQSLSAVAVLDIDSMEQVPSIRDMVKNSSSTLKSLTLTLSGRLASRARVRKPNGINDQVTITDPMDLDDGWNIAPPLGQQQQLIQANVNAGLDPNQALNIPGLPPIGNTPTTIAGAKKEQETILGQILDVNKAHETKLDGELEKVGGPALGSMEDSFAAIEKIWTETRNLMSESGLQDEAGADMSTNADSIERMERLRELTVSLKKLTKNLSDRVPNLSRPEPPAKPGAHSQTWDQDDYANGIPPPLPMGNGLPPIPLPLPTIHPNHSQNIAQYSDWPASVNPGKKSKKFAHKAFPVSWPAPYVTQSSSKPLQVLGTKDYHQQLLDLSKVYTAPFGADSAPNGVTDFDFTSIGNGSASMKKENIPFGDPVLQSGATSLPDSNGSGEGMTPAESDEPGLFDNPNSAAARSKARLQKKRDMQPEDIDIAHDPEVISTNGDADEDGDGGESDDGTVKEADQGTKGKKKAEPPQMTLQDYIRSTAGISLEAFSLYLIPLKTSAMIKAINFGGLQSLTLLDVGSQKQLWNHLLHVNIHNPLTLSKISTDHVTPEFLSLLSKLPKVTELYLYERSSTSTKYEPSVEPTNVTVRTMRRLALSKHMYTLRRLYVQCLGHADKHWDFDLRMISLIISRGRNLEELGCTMMPEAVQILTQHLNAVPKLRALSLFQVRRSTRHSSSGYATVHTNYDILNPMANTCAMAPKLAFTYLALGGQLYVLRRIDEATSARSFSILRDSSDDSSSDDDAIPPTMNPVTTMPSTSSPYDLLNLLGAPGVPLTNFDSVPLPPDGESFPPINITRQATVAPRKGLVDKKALFRFVDKANWPRDVRILRKDVMSASL